MCKLILWGVFWLGWIWCSFCRDSKRHLSHTRLSPCQISHPCFKLWKCASFSSNYLQVLIGWPNQFTSLPSYFFEGAKSFYLNVQRKGNQLQADIRHGKFQLQQLKFGKATSNWQQPCKGKCQAIPELGRASSSTCSLAGTAWALSQLHALSQAILKESGEVICGVYCEWIANNMEAGV